MKKIILASRSYNRQRFLKALGIPFRVIVSDFNEKSIKESNEFWRCHEETQSITEPSHPFSVALIAV